MRHFPIHLLGVLLCLSTTAAAQDHQHQHGSADPPADAWAWATDANVFVGYNYQQRKFADFSSWESQNWFMLDGSRKMGRGRLTVDAMFSLEPFTIPSSGSPQLYQTGESYLLTTDGIEERIPLVNAQHPHDLFMGLGATYRVEHRGVAFTFGADLV